MAENKEYLTHTEAQGCIHISEDVLASIAASAALEVEGVSSLMNTIGKKSAAKGVRVSVDESGALLDLHVVVRYGYAIPEVAERIQKAVSSAVEAMTGFPSRSIQVHVGGIDFE